MMANVNVKTKCVLCLDGVCLDEVSALPCGHTFHYHCIYIYLHTWRNCPSCNAPASADSLITKLYFNFEEMEPSSKEVQADQEQVSNLQAELCRSEKDRSSLNDELFFARQKAAQIEMEVFSLKTSLFREQRKHSETRNIFLVANLEVVKARNEIANLRAELYRMQEELAKVMKELSQSGIQVEEPQTQVAYLEENSASLAQDDPMANLWLQITREKATEPASEMSNSEMECMSSKSEKNAAEQHWSARKRFLTYGRHISICNGKIVQSKCR